MLPGISSLAFYPHCLTTTHLDALAATGADAIEIFAARFHFDYTDRQRVRQTASWFNSSGVRPTLHAPITADRSFSRHASPSLNLVSMAKPDRIAAMEEIKRALETAELIPFATCVLHLGLTGDRWSDYALEHAITAIEHLKAFAGPLSVRLLLENLRNEIASPAHLLDILQIGHFDTTGICLDLGHAHLMAAPLHETVQLLRDKIAEVHLHDNHGATGGPASGAPDEHLWPGKGTIAWQEAYALLGTLPETTTGVLEIADTQVDGPGTVTKLGREAFEMQRRLGEQREEI